MTLRQGDLGQQVVARNGERSAALRVVLWLPLCLLALATAYGLLEGEGGLADFRFPAAGLAVAVLVLALALRRHFGAVVAFACGAIQAVWLMPALLSPSVAIADVPDGATRVASIDRLVAGYAPDTAWEAVTVRFRNDGTIVIQWLEVWRVDEPMGAANGRTPLPQPI